MTPLILRSSLAEDGSVISHVKLVRFPRRPFRPLLKRGRSHPWPSQMARGLPSSSVVPTLLKIPRSSSRGRSKFGHTWHRCRSSQIKLTVCFSSLFSGPFQISVVHFPVIFRGFLRVNKSNYRRLPPLPTVGACYPLEVLWVTWPVTRVLHPL